jgi:type I restriction enzyme S subunit
LLLSIFASLGKTTRLAIEATMNQAILGLQTKPGFSTAFLEYFLKDCSRYISVFSSSNTQENLNLNKIKNLVMVLPPEAEQTAAAAFLDDKTAQIDTLIEKKRKLIELLKEERQAVINEAVTKGMNPKARMKPSGVEWLGDVPEGWEVIPFKRLCERIVVGIAEAATHAYRETGTPILRSTNVKDGKLSGSILHIDEEFAGGRDSKSIRAYDIVTVRTGNAGESAVVPLEFDGCQCFTMLISTLRQPNLAAFYNYLLNSETGKTYFELTAWGTAQKNISVPILQEFIVSHPSGAEQEEIVQYLDQKAQQSNELIERAQKEMELLQEYRTALITEVVTGKVCVV